MIKRNKNAAYLDKILSRIEQVKLPIRDKNNYEAYVVYMARFQNRDKLKSFLIKSGIDAKIHYPVPLHLQIPGKKLGYKKGDFPEAEIQAKELLTLPIHQYINKQHLDYMINIICKFYNISL